VPVDQFVIGLPSGGALHEAFSSDDALFGGGGRHQTKSVTASGEAFLDNLIGLLLTCRR